MTLILIALAASALAATTYLLLERAGRKAWPAMACRAAAWTALGVLLANLTCAAPTTLSRPLVLFDGSLSLGAAGGRWREALDTARTLGEVRWFGDEDGGAGHAAVGGTEPARSGTRGGRRLRIAR